MLGDGSVFGTFCAVDTKPLNLTTAQVHAMEHLATLVSYAVDIERVATHDQLTGLYNTSLFEDHLTLEMAHASRNGSLLAVLYMDLDQFKPVNDQFGHDVGNHVLASVGARLNSTIRRGDTAARIGGDEFALLLPDIRNVKAAARVAETVLESIQDPIIVADHDIHITACIGVAVYPVDAKNSAALVRCADAAMYAAKAGGGGTFRLHSELNPVDTPASKRRQPALRLVHGAGE